MIKLAQIGMGQWGQNLLRTYLSLSDCQMKICCDEDQKTLEKFSRLYHNKFGVTQHFDDILNDPEIQGVIIATPAITHANLAMRALCANKHVFVEKPLALSVNDGMRMIELAHQNNRLLMVGHLLLYHPAVQKLKNAVDTGQLGDIHYLYSTRVNLGTIREEENALWSLTVHDISVAMHLLNQAPLEVTATGSAYLRKDVHDVVFVTLYFKNNVMSHIHASWLDPHKIRKFTVVGSKKMAVFDDMESSEKLKFYDKGVERMQHSGGYETFLTLREGDIHIPHVHMMEPLKLECQHFIDSIAYKKPVLSDGHNGLNVLKVLTAAQESLMTHGKPIRI
ncbi:MAG: Gfo/Idh/MocA family oxidoreductase [Deltaproteobacteria bacterium]|nr:Gfo/Idh/MocA family oxidoreductase [Deltaproteobacteria bacterium]